MWENMYEYGTGSGLGKIFSDHFQLQLQVGHDHFDMPRFYVSTLERATALHIIAHVNVC